MVTPRWLFVTRFKNTLATVMHTASGTWELLQECHLRKSDVTQVCLYSNISHPLLNWKLLGFGFNGFMLHDFKHDLLRFWATWTDFFVKDQICLLRKCQGKIISLENPSRTFASLSCSSLRWLINWCLRRGGSCVIVHHLQHLSIDTWDEEEYQCVHHYQHL